MGRIIFILEFYNRISNKVVADKIYVVYYPGCSGNGERLRLNRRRQEYKINLF